MKTTLTILSITALLIFSACTSNMRISVLKPANVDIPKDVKRIVVLNNTLLSNKDKLTVLEGVLSGEQLYGDKNASQACVQALARTINTSNMYKAVQRGEKSLLSEDRSVNWEIVQEICDKEESQLLVSLDFFDTNSGLGSTVLTGTNRVSGTAHFSIYYPAEKFILTDYVVTDTKATGSAAGSLNPLEMVNDALIKSQMLKDVGDAVGAKAGSQLVPTWIWVGRMYYTGGGRELRHAKRLIRSGNWEVAEQKLGMATAVKSQRRVGKAYYNLALCREGQGDLSGAIQHAETAAIQYNNKNAPQYITVLKNRLADEARLEYQLTKEEEE